MEFDRIGPAGSQTADGTGFLPSETLSRFAQEAFSRLSFTFTREHLDHLVSVARSGENTPNDRMVASFLLENAVISAKGTFPLCQDTGIANVFVWKDDSFRTQGDDTADISAGIETAYRTRNLRFSTNIPDSLFAEHDPGNNMPAQVLVSSSQAKPGSEPSCRFLFCAKGGGSSNKTHLVQATKAILTEKAFDAWLREEIPALGTAACPPYSISVVAGGLSPEQNLLALKLATAGYFDEKLPGWDYRVMGTEPFRVSEWEERVLRIAGETGLGAQFGGKALAVSARVLRLPRHGASCPVSIGVSCSAHRNLQGYIDRTGLFLQHTENDPLSVPGVREAVAQSPSTSDQRVKVDLDGGMDKVRSSLSGLPTGTAVLLSGTILVARDAAHARWRMLIAEGKSLPEYTVQFPILYAGPAGTPSGRVTGSFGPTTAGRMDDYADELMSRGAALVTIAKGNRSEAWRAACAKYGATYLGTVGGAAALIAERHIVSSEVIDYPELGMEAVRRMTVKDLPAFVLVNDRGEDFYRTIKDGKK